MKSRILLGGAKVIDQPDPRYNDGATKDMENRQELTMARTNEDKILNPQIGSQRDVLKAFGIESEITHQHQTDDRQLLEATIELYQKALTFFITEGEQDLKTVSDALGELSLNPADANAADNIFEGNRFADLRGLQDMLQGMKMKSLPPAMAMAVRTFEEMLKRCVSWENLIDAMRKNLDSLKAKSFKNLATTSEINYPAGKTYAPMVAGANGSSQPAYQIMKTGEPHADRPAGHARGKHRSLDNTDPNISGNQPTD